MVPVELSDPQHASDYSDRTTTAVKRVLVEVGQILGSFRGKFAVVGGAVPWLLLDNPNMSHVGTVDIDLGLDAEALGDGEYATLVESLVQSGYEQRAELRRFQLARRIDVGDGGPPIEVIVDFLMPRDAEIVKNQPPLVDHFAVQRADGAELALRFYQFVAIEGQMPNGGQNTVKMAVASIPALLDMKGFAINNRLKRKDSYDIYYCIRNYPDGVGALAEDCRPILADEKGAEGYTYIAEKFDAEDSFGPVSVREFVEESELLGDRTAEQWQRDAFGQVDAWLRALGLRD